MERHCMKKIDQLLFFSWAVALVATWGSLYFSEIKHFIPCTLCWYQRIFMYPLVLQITIAYVKKEYTQSFYLWIASSIGACFSLYHYVLEKVPLFHAAEDACGVVPCNIDYINWFGFITIPLLALVAFVIVAIVNYYIWRRTQ